MNYKYKKVAEHFPHDGFTNSSQAPPQSNERDQFFLLEKNEFKSVALCRSYRAN